MRNQEDEMLKKCLRQTMEQIQPDEETKKRMYLEIMRRASAAERSCCPTRTHCGSSGRNRS